MDHKKIPPTPLILYSQESHSYILTPEAKKLFSSIPSNHQIAIITILGPYRTGKSLLLNRVLLSKEQGFQVGNTVNSCTKGLWVYSISGKEFLKSLPSGETSGLSDESTVLIIDTEGFGSVNVSQTHDNRIFLMALMISSLVIYNSVGTIDENALNQLALITSLSNEIQSKLDAPITMPFFLWILRDFMLKLEDKNGNKINSKDYLESSLELQKGVSDIIEKKNKVRRMFIHYFPERDCVTLPRPIEGEEELGKLNDLDDHMMRKEFLEQLNGLRVKVLKKCTTKNILVDSKNKVSKPIIGGTMIMSLCNSFLEVINEGKICKIESIWSMVSSNEAQKWLQKSLENFDQIKEKFLAGSKELKKENIQEFRKIVRKEILSSYLEKIKHLEMNNQEGLYRSLMDGIADKLINFEKDNKTQWKKKYESFMEAEMEKFEEKALEYDSYFDFREDLQRLQEKFEKEMRGGYGIKRFFLKFSLRMWIKYIESFARKQKKLENQKMETLELLKLVKEKKSSDNHKPDTDKEKQELAKLFELVQAQLQESRQVQDQILTSIKDQKDQKEKELSQTQSQSFLLPQQSHNILMDSPKSKTPEPSITMDEKVMETNRFLSMALEKTEDLLKKQEIILKKQEKKVEKYREFKKFLTLASSIECNICHDSQKPFEFLSHATNCKVVKKPVVESPGEVKKKLEFQHTSYLPNDSYSTGLNSNLQRTTMSPMSTSIVQNRGATSLLPRAYEQPNFPLSYAHQLATHMKKDSHHLSIQVDDDREEHRKAKSFYQSPPQNQGSYLDEFEDNSDNLYNKPRPLISGGSKRFGKEDLEIDVKAEKDLNLPFMKPNFGTNYWESPLSDVLGGKKHFVVGEEKFKDFNLTLIPEGEMKTMNYVKKKSKGSSQGLDNTEEQGIKGLVKGQKGINDRRNSWNFNFKSGDFHKKEYE